MFERKFTCVWPAAFCLLVVVPTAAAQSPQADALTPQEAQQDFEVLWRAIEEAHGGITRFSTKAELKGELETYRARLDRPMTRQVFAGILAESIAKLRDGHARLELDSRTRTALEAALVLPLRVQFEDGRLVVMFNDSPGDTTIRPGMEIVSISGRSVKDLLGMLWPKVSGDGFIETGRWTRLARELPQLLWLYVEQAESYAIVAQDTAGRRVSATIAGVRERERRTSENPVNEQLTEQLARLNGPPGSVALQYLADSSIARLRIRYFDGEDFPARLDSVFTQLHGQRVQGLILDLRGNGGGVDELGALLVSYSVDEPFRYFDHIHVTTIAPSFATWPQRTFEAIGAGSVPDSQGGYRVTPSRHSGVGEQQPAPNPFRGRLVVLIDGGTFSTAADVTAHLRSRGRAVFVGEETAGTYEGNTSGLNALIVLPNSRLGLKIMMYGYWNAVEPAELQGRGTLPDYEVKRHVSDLVRGIDLPLERAIAVLRQ